MTTTLKSKSPSIPKFFKFLNNDTLIDCTIVADGHMMNAHKIVLAASSSYFEVTTKLSFLWGDWNYFKAGCFHGCFHS